MKSSENESNLSFQLYFFPELAFGLHQEPSSTDRIQCSSTAFKDFVTSNPEIDGDVSSGIGNLPKKDRTFRVSSSRLSTIGG